MAAHRSAEPEYDGDAIRFLETLWGEGFLSPGGSEEIDRVLDGVSLIRARVLDIGCGTGAAVMRMGREHGAVAVTGFDVAFSKDAILHVPDKTALFREVARVLKPGGVFAASDWLIGHDGEPSPAMTAYLKAEGLSFSMRSPQFYRHAMASAGFEAIRITSRYPWYREQARAERRRLDGEVGRRVAAALGDAYLAKQAATWDAMQKVLDSGEHQPTHLRGRKPG